MKMKSNPQFRKAAVCMLAFFIVMGLAGATSANAADLNTKVSGFLSTSNNFLLNFLGGVTGFVFGGGGSGFVLTVYGSGTGSGSMTGSGISCNWNGATSSRTGTCVVDYGDFTSVTITATPSLGHTFTGWTGCNSVNGAQCSVTLGGTNKAITASFSAPGSTFSLSVTKNPTAGGTVNSNDGKIACGADCFESYAGGTGVTLTPSVNAGYAFTSWSGACFGQYPTCTLTMDASKTATANFAPTYTLTADKKVGGAITAASGTISGALSCGTSCSTISGSFASGSTQTLTATSASGYSFSSWTGCTSVSGTQCSVGMSANKAVTVNFNQIQYFSLTVTKAGKGSVTSISPPIGINCGSDCTESYTQSTYVTLRAAPDTGATFSSWTGCDTVSGTDCSVTMSAARTATANFKHTLTVQVTGSGTISDPNVNYILCPTDCTESFTPNTQVTLQMFSMGPNTVFAGWGGACTGTGNCLVTMDAGKTVTATFSPTGTLTVSKIGTGGGTVTSSPAGINCGVDCSEQYTGGPTVTLTANADANSYLKLWQGCDSFSGNTCTVTITGAKAVTATFDKITYALTVAKSGAGTVTSNPVGISCGTDCAETYDTGTKVNLTAAPDAGYAFSSWGGACSGIAKDWCEVTMDSVKTASATFAVIPPAISATHTPVSPTTQQSVTVTITGSSGVGLTIIGAELRGPISSRLPNGNQIKSCQVTGTTASCTAVFEPLPVGAYTYAPFGYDTLGTLGQGVNGSFGVVQPPIQKFELTINTVGNGSGSVSRSIVEQGSCGTNCFKYEKGTSITLTANSDSTSIFGGWAGDCTGSGSTCSLTINDNKQATATFTLKPPDTHQLLITKLGNGSGTVSSNIGGINCGSVCSGLFSGETVVLAATPAQNSTFDGWSGDCTGVGVCSLPITLDKQATATFTLKKPAACVVDFANVTLEATQYILKPGAPFQIIIRGLCPNQLFDYNRTITKIS